MVAPFTHPHGGLRVHRHASHACRHQNTGEAPEARRNLDHRTLRGRQKDGLSTNLWTPKSLCHSRPLVNSRVRNCVACRWTLAFTACPVLAVMQNGSHDSLAAIKSFRLS